MYTGTGDDALEWELNFIIVSTRKISVVEINYVGVWREGSTLKNELTVGLSWGTDVSKRVTYSESPCIKVKS